MRTRASHRAAPHRPQGAGAGVLSFECMNALRSGHQRCGEVRAWDRECLETHSAARVFVCMCGAAHVFGAQQPAKSSCTRTTDFGTNARTNIEHGSAAGGCAASHACRPITIRPVALAVRPHAPEEREFIAETLRQRETDCTSIARAPARVHVYHRHAATHRTAANVPGNKAELHLHTTKCLIRTGVCAYHVSEWCPD